MEELRALQEHAYQECTHQECVYLECAHQVCAHPDGAGGVYAMLGKLIT